MPGVQVFATDIDAAAIDRARAAVYASAVAADIPPSHVNRYFVKEGGDHLRVQKGIRERVLFAHHNILRDPPFSKLDLIACRNLLIYLNRDVQRDVLEIFHFALRPGGFLFLGSSESADAAPGLFTVVDKKHRIYRANDIAPTISRIGTSAAVGVEPRMLEQRGVAGEIKELLGMRRARHRPEPRPLSAGQDHRNDQIGHVALNPPIPVCHDAPRRPRRHGALDTAARTRLVLIRRRPSCGR